MNKLLKILTILIFCLHLTTGFGKTRFEINTGDSSSASWQFTLSLSKYWTMKYQDKTSYFAPGYVDSFYQRFFNLDQGNCKLTIAPLNSLTELPISDLDIKIAAVLWQVYLAPVDLEGNNEAISQETATDWYIPDKSLILPHYLTQLRSIAANPMAIVEPDLKQFVQTVDWLFYDPGQYEFQDNSVTDAVFQIDEESSFLNQSVPNDKTPDDAADKTIEISSDDDQLDDLTIVETYRYIKTVDRFDLVSTVSELDSGIVFFEMIGPAANLMDQLGKGYELVSLQRSFRRHLLKYNRFLESFDFTNKNISTVSVTFALFVHGTEDPEFVKELVELLDQQPRSFFPRDYIISNLSLDETKEISPLFLHEGAIDYFNIDYSTPTVY